MNSGSNSEGRLCYFDVLIDSPYISLSYEDITMEQDDRNDRERLRFEKKGLYIIDANFGYKTTTEENHARTEATIYIDHNDGSNTTQKIAKQGGYVTRGNANITNTNFNCDIGHVQIHHALKINNINEWIRIYVSIELQDNNFVVKPEKNMTFCRILKVG